VLLPPRFAPPTYVVESGDTLYRIAGEYGVSVRSLKETNDLDTTALRPGQRLRIPGRSAPDASGAAPADTTGPVSLFPATFAGRLTASGEPYDPDAFVASHPSLPYGSVVLLSYEDTRSHAFARIVDRGPVDENALLEVSDAVAQQLGLDPNSNSPVQLRVVWVERR
jgi:rare lipoprotein A (peptidoglycan hydrolase)